MGELELLSLTASAATICAFQVAWFAAAMKIGVKVITMADAHARGGPGVDVARDAGSQ
jgi:hypothetical protein